MSVAHLRPATVAGTIDAPPSKSYTHRLLVAAHLSGRPGRVRRPLRSDDTVRTARGLRQLGSVVELREDSWTVTTGAADRHRRPRTVDCGESGTTLRFLTAAAALRRERYRFVGRGRLPRRPMAPLLNALERLGAEVVRGSPAASLPFEVRGPIHGGEVALSVAESSQHTSALLLTLPTVGPRSAIRTVGTQVSEPYVRATLAVLRRQGIRVEVDRGAYRVPGPQVYRSVDEAVPGDASSAAYLWALAAISGGTVTVRGVPPSWPQADLAVLDLLRRYGATILRSRAAVTVVGGARRPFRTNLTDAPDLYPLAGVLAAAAEGRSLLMGAEHVAAKESDRRAGTEALVRTMGARATSVRGGLAIEGVRSPRPIRLRRASDHRIVMSAAVAASAGSGPSAVGDAAAVGKSYPGFFRDVQRLGLEVAVR
jgi:3-phosphoshikimate 1-carboxyvinyltransferase